MTPAAQPPATRTLPDWNLDDLYSGPDAPELERDLAGAERDARAFRERHAGRLADLSGAELGRAVAEYERIDEVLGRVGSYAQLLNAADLASPETGRFCQSVRERVTAIATDLLFLVLELNRIGQEDLDRALAAPELARYAPWLRDVRAFRDFQLGEELEEVLHRKSVAGRVAWVRLFDETLAGIVFEVDGESLGLAEVLDMLSDRDGSRRRAAALALARELRARERLFCLVTNTLAKDKEIEDRLRGYRAPVSMRNLDNRVEDDVVEALVSAVTAGFSRLAHRYYAIKARWFGVDTLAYWDRNAPLPDDDDREVSWDEACGIVLGSWTGFSPRMAELGRRFFDNRWIDARPRPGKAPGAFSHPTVPSAHPYILMNYLGRTRDVMVLAHELGHGVHQLLAARQGHLMADTPLTLAETASVFAEMLTFQELLAGADRPGQRRALLAGKVEDMLNTVVRQIAFHHFETRLHAERRKGELTPDAIGDIWIDVQEQSLGPAIRLDDDYRVFWAYVPHFIHSPFYVYAYAFGDCLVNSLYAVYRESPHGFSDAYLEALAAGGSRRHRELLAPFGLDASDPGFWDRGLGLIETFIDELDATG
ncbi:MAG: M3 family oligoendopeptidase [Alphaproteobacteria bacterium]|nr:M3 family oligoendopeptidase [Alphaproteobacteria bacterium]